MTPATPTESQVVRAGTTDRSLTADAHYAADWGGLRARRMLATVVAFLFLPAAFAIGGQPGLLVPSAALFICLHALRAWRCPRCRDQFAGVGTRWWPTHCAACALPEFAPHDEVVAPAPVDRVAARRLAPRFRRFVAASQVVGGTLVIGLYVWLPIAGVGVPWWYAALLEGFGATALAAGVWLWRDAPRGYSLSRVLQALQLVQFQSATLSYGLILGFNLALSASEARINLGPGLYGAFNLAWGTSPPSSVTINLLAAFVLILLWGARPAAEVEPAAPRPAEP